MVFLKNKQDIDDHNKLDSQYKLGVNKFTALTHREFIEIVSDIRGLPHSPRVQDEIPTKVGISIDWSTTGAVKPVRDEGQCGASYAYAALAAIEAQLYIKTMTSVNLSWQQILDCSSSYGNYGCNGGLMTNCFKYAHDKGLTTEEAYPYTASSAKCKIDSGQYKVTKYAEGPKGSCTTLTNLLNQGPVSIGIDSTPLQSYHSGIFTCNSSSTASSGALMVGQTDTAWKVQMNFGEKSGIKGYIYLSPGNNCAVCDYVSIPCVI